LHFCKDLSDKDIKIAILFIIASQRIRYSGINLTKEVKDFHTQNNKILMKEIEENKNNRMLFYVYELEGLVLLKYPYRLKKHTDSTPSLSKSQLYFS
jgi:hypothetical protein